MRELVKTRYGFHIVAVDRRIPGRLLPFESVQEKIAEHLINLVEEKALRQYVSEDTLGAVTRCPERRGGYSPTRPPGAVTKELRLLSTAQAQGYSTALNSIPLDGTAVLVLKLAIFAVD